MYCAGFWGGSAVNHYRYTWAWRARSLLAVVMLTTTLTCGSGCKMIRRYAMGQVADILADSTKGFHSDDDPELVREALPFGLKLIEGTLQETPRHRKLLLHACSGFTEYAYGFVKQDADMLEDKDYARCEELRLRCKKLLLRARGYGLQGLEVTHSGFEARLRSDPKQAVAELDKDDACFAYWVGACWGAAISLDKNDTELIADQGIVIALLRRALELDEACEYGAVHDAMISYEMARMDGTGDQVQKARAHFDRSVEISQGRLAAPYVTYAEAVCLQTQDRRGFEEMLGKALAIDSDAYPDGRVVNLVMQRRAKWLLSQVNDLFVE